MISSTSTAGGITKIGTGTLTPSGVNTYTGPTLVSGGTLEIAPTGILATTTNVTINATTAAATMKIDPRSASGIQAVTVGNLSRWQAELSPWCSDQPCQPHGTGHQFIGQRR